MNNFRKNGVEDESSRSSRPAANTHRTGLGLASVKGFVDAHGGALTVESQPNEGNALVR